MVKYKNLNNISEQLEKDIPALKGEVVFQMLNGHKNNDNDRAERDKNPYLFGKTQIGTFHTIKDPHTNKMVQIGAAMEVSPDGERATSFRPFLAGQHTDVFNGKFSLVEGNVLDEELFQIFWLSPEREGSPCADARIKPVFKIINHKEENQKVVSRIQSLREALDDLKTLTPEDYTQLAYSQNWSETDMDAIEAKVSEMARGDADKYLKLRKDPNTAIKANLKKAFDKQLLELDLMTGDVTTGGNKITNIAKDSRGEYLEAMAVWINSAKNGKQVYEGILKQLG